MSTSTSTSTSTSQTSSSPQSSCFMPLIASCPPPPRPRPAATHLHAPHASATHLHPPPQARDIVANIARPGPLSLGSQTPRAPRPRPWQHLVHLPCLLHLLPCSPARGPTALRIRTGSRPHLARLPGISPAPILPSFPAVSVPAGTPCPPAQHPCRKVLACACHSSRA